MTDPRRMELYRRGVAGAEAFLRVNGLRYPAWALNGDLPLRGLYEPAGERVSVNLANCVVEDRIPGNPAWNLAGYRIDVTPVGVVAHETGHHVHHLLGWSGVPADWYRKRVSSYEPDWAESVAETVKLLITNPDMLRRGMPARWRVVTETWRLTPAHDRDYRVVLREAGADRRVLTAARGWVNLRGR